MILVPIGVWFALNEIHAAYAPAANHLQDRDTNSVVALPNGTTLFEPGGTAGRDIVDWLDTHQHGSEVFEVGGNQFLGDTAELTPESVGRITRLAAMLMADEEVSATIIGYSAPEPRDRLGQSLAALRAERVRDELVQFGVPADRVTAEARGDSKLIAKNDNAIGRQKNERVAVLLTHDPVRSND